ncbi:MAG: hypothetical protein RBR53_02585 [Desulforegulaceae bacterium]|nr:hypothetical protein [Desulforegulaceae bacterium]
MKKNVYSIFFIVFFFSFGAQLSKASENKVKFIFAPKDKMVMLERVVAVNEQILNEEVLEKQESSISTRITYNKTKNGFELKAEITKIEFFINGEKTENPVFEVLKECPIIYEVDKFGNFVDLKGYDKFNSLLYEKFTKEFADEISKIYSEDKMKEKAKSDWDQKTGNYLGKTVYHGEKWKNKEVMVIPGGQKTKVDFETIFFLNEKIKGKDCAKIKILFKIPDISAKDLKGQIEIYLNPLTMDVYSVLSERDFTIGTGKEEILMKEKREYNYEYIY